LPQILGEIYSNQELPKELLVDLALNINETDIAAGGGNSVEAWLAAIAGHTVNIKVPQRGEKFELMQTVRRNAQEALVQFLSKRSADASVSGAALEQLQIELGLPALPLRIECFDISNTQGTNSVASMVVFEDGRPAKSGYRRFAIKGEQLLDDTRAMNQVLSRRLQRLIDEEQIDQLEIKVAGAATPKFSYRPQLIVVDGGAPQVAAAAAVLAQMEISDISLIGLAKRLEEVWLPGESDPIILPRHSEALYLLQRLRDEAHRFAITFHRSKRAKAMLESLFDEIPGLGEARRKALLGAFGSVAAIKKVDVGEIAAVPGIGEKLAQLIFDRLQDAVQVDLLTGEILE
jgi:excinuclease ABC subunit C